MVINIPPPSIDPVDKVPPTYGGPVPIVVIRKVGDYAEVRNVETNTILTYSLNHTSVFQKAFDSLEDGGLILVKQGSYSIETIELTNHKFITLQGTNRWATKLVAKNNTKPIIKIDGQDPYNRQASEIVIRDIMFKGASNPQSGHHLLELRNTHEIYVDNVLFEGGYRGIYMKEVTRIHLSKIWCYAPYANGIYVDTGTVLADQLWMDDIQVTDAPNARGVYIKDFDSYRITRAYITGTIDAIRIVKTDSGVKDCIGWIANVDVDLNSGSGIFIDGQGGVIKKVAITDAWIAGSGGYGLHIYNAKYITVLGGWFAASSQHGVFVKDSEEVSIVNARIYNNGQGYAGERDGVMIYNSRKVKVIGCMIFDDQPTPTQRYGVREEGGSDYNLILGNTFFGNISGDLSISGTNTVTANNIST